MRETNQSLEKRLRLRILTPAFLPKRCAPESPKRDRKNSAPKSLYSGVLHRLFSRFSQEKYSKFS